MGRRLDNAHGLYLDAIRDGHATDAINMYSGSRYTQHSTPVKDGREGFIEFFEDFYVRNPIRDIEIMRSFEDGRFIFLHVLQTLNNGEFQYVTADIFDTDDDGKLIEHWDMIDEVVDGTGSGPTQIDGPTEPTDLDKTEQNKVLVRSFLTEAVQSGHVGNLADYVSTDSFIEHNPNVDDGLISRVGHEADRGEPTTYTEIHNVIGSGSFVAAMSQMSLADTDVAVIDLFRIAGGRILEHWDVAEHITPRDTWVNSGKF